MKGCLATQSKLTLTVPKNVLLVIGKIANHATDLLVNKSTDKNIN